jgi:hypothetical protein
MLEGTQVNQSGEIGDRKTTEESTEAILAHRPGWIALVLGLAFAIGFLGVSAYLRRSGISGGELRWVMMLFLFPAEWGGALLILALLSDFKRALERGRSRDSA